jgi:hypothetical protein
MPKNWSTRVTHESNALDLEKNVFTLRSAKEIASSLKRSSDLSHRRKAGPFQSAMSMLNFYINRAGRNLTVSRRKVLNQAKDELRSLYGRKTYGRRTRLAGDKRPSSCLRLKK